MTQRKKALQTSWYATDISCLCFSFFFCFKKTKTRASKMGLRLESRLTIANLLTSRTPIAPSWVRVDLWTRSGAQVSELRTGQYNANSIQWLGSSFKMKKMATRCQVRSGQVSYRSGLHLPLHTLSDLHNQWYMFDCLHHHLNITRTSLNPQLFLQQTGDRKRFWCRAKSESVMEEKGDLVGR